VGQSVNLEWIVAGIQFDWHNGFYYWTTLNVPPMVLYRNTKYMQYNIHSCRSVSFGARLWLLICNSGMRNGHRVFVIMYYTLCNLKDDLVAMLM